MGKEMFKKIKEFFKKKNKVSNVNNIDDLDILKPDNNSYIINYRVIKYYRGFVD